MFGWLRAFGVFAASTVHLYERLISVGTAVVTNVRIGFIWFAAERSSRPFSVNQRRQRQDDIQFTFFRTILIFRKSGRRQERYRCRLLEFPLAEEES